MHIVHIIPTLRHGGAEQLVVLLSNDLVFRGHNVSIITFGDDVPLAALLHPDVQHVVVQKKGKVSLGLIGALKKTLTEIKPDIVHTHLFGADVWGRLAAHSLGIPIVTTEHNINTAEGYVKHVVKRLLKKKSQQYVAVSEHVRAYMKQRYHVEDATVIHPAIDTKQFDQVPPLTMHEPISILMIGRLALQKGFDLGIEALETIQDLPWQAVIVGSGEEEQTLRALIASKGLAQRIRMQPATTDVVAVYQEADIVLMPSRWEGFGMVGIEAIASGRLLIASAVGGMQDILEDKKTGLRIDPGSIESCREAVAWALTHPKEAVSMAKDARAEASQFDISYMTDQYLVVYTDLV